MAGSLGVVGAFAVGDNAYFAGKVGIHVSLPPASVQMQINAPAGTEGLRIISADNWSPFNIQNSSGVDIFRVNQAGTLAVGSVPWGIISGVPVNVNNAISTLTAGTGITVSGSGSSRTITNSAPDQTVTLTGAGGTTISGAYPSFTITSTDSDTTYTAGTGISIAGTVITNSSPDRTVSLTGSGATTITGTYPNFTISSSDTNTDTKWDGGATGLNAANGRSALGLGSLATLSSVSGGNITDGTITSADINNTSVQQRVSGACSSGTSINAINADGTATCQAAGSGTVTSITAGAGLSGGVITTSGTISLNTANPNTWTGAQTFSGQVNATGGLCLNGDCKTSWSQAGATSERIVQKVTRNGTWSGYNCASTGGDTADGDPCDNDFYKCTRDDAINNRSYTDVFGYNGWDAVDTIQCSMEYTSDSSDSFQIELNDPSDTNWTCGDYNLQDYCGDEDGCRIMYYGQHKIDDSTRSIENFIYMEQPGWSSNVAAGLYGYTRQDGGEYGWVNGNGTGYNILNLWGWTYAMNYYWSACGGNNTAFSDPYVFRFATHPQIHSKYIIYNQP